MKQTKRVATFAGVGLILTVFDYVVFEILVLVFFHSAEWSAAATAIAGVISTFLGYILHNNITWKERDPGRYGVVKFFIWNLSVMVGLRPILMGIFGLLTGLYAWAFGITSWLHLPFSYDFVSSTGIYALTTIVTMILNFFVYERLVFGEKRVV